jgi:hypothetical protein
MSKRLLIVTALFFTLCFSHPVLGLSIVSFEPSRGPIGTIVTIKGVGFHPTPNQNQVTFQGLPAEVLLATDTSLQVKVPKGAAYSIIAVEASGLVAQSVQFFLVTGGCQEATFIQKPLFTSTYNYDIVTGNFNGDGYPDFAIGIVDTLSVFYGNGKGDFTSVKYPVPNIVANYLIVGDFNNDNIQDLASANAGPDGTISILLGQATGGFIVESFSSTSMADPRAITTADFNQDGKLDLAMPSQNQNKLEVFLANGEGKFTSHQILITGVTPFDIKSVDANRDGKIDLLVGHRVDGMYVYEGDGRGNFKFSRGYVGASFHSTRLCLGDFNGDGIQDVASSDASNYVQAAIDLGHGPDTAYAYEDAIQYINSTVSSWTWSIHTGDFNGDGIEDLITNSLNKAVSILLGQGDGKFVPQEFLPLSHSGFSLTVGDFNQDSRHDFVVASESGQMTLFLSECGLATTLAMAREEAPFRLYPNPSKGTVNIQGTEIIESLSVLDMKGVLVVEQKPLSSTTTLQVQAEGVYQIILRTSQKTSLHRWVVAP